MRHERTWWMFYRQLMMADRVFVGECRHIYEGLEHVAYRPVLPTPFKELFDPLGQNSEYLIYALKVHCRVCALQD